MPVYIVELRAKVEVRSDNPLPREAVSRAAKRLLILHSHPTRGYGLDDERADVVLVTESAKVVRERE